MQSDRIRLADMLLRRALSFAATAMLTTSPLLGQARQKPSAAVPFSTLPANPSTTLATYPPEHVPTQRASVQRADVAYSAGLLTVTAANSSLRDILHAIASATGMKITGLVSDDRVFGKYGPDVPSKVLDTLLDGTGSNMLLVQDANQNPTELVLTPQRGGATPPNPNASNASDNDADDAVMNQPQPQIQPPQIQPQQIQPPQMQPHHGRPNMNPAFLGNRPQSSNTGGEFNQPAPNPAATQPSSSTETVVFPPIDGNSTPSTGTATPNASTSPPGSQPDTVKTPQQIFEQLQKLREQQQNSPTSIAPQ